TDTRGNVASGGVPTAGPDSKNRLRRSNGAKALWRSGATAEASLQVARAWWPAALCHRSAVKHDPDHDRSVSAVLDRLTRVVAAIGFRDHRLRVEHALF